MTVIGASQDTDMDITPVLQAMGIPLDSSTPHNTDVPNKQIMSPVIENTVSLLTRKKKSSASEAPGQVYLLVVHSSY